MLICSTATVAAALGLTTVVFQGLLSQPGLAFYEPFATAVLLVAFGSDYNVFAVGTIWREAAHAPLARALPRTAAAISTAGLTLAASFAPVAVIPWARSGRSRSPWELACSSTPSWSGQAGPEPQPAHRPGPRQRLARPPHPHHSRPRCTMNVAHGASHGGAGQAGATRRRRMLDLGPGLLHNRRMTGDQAPGRTLKYRVLRVMLRGGNRVLRQALRRGIAPPAVALLETTGRRSGQPRHTPVCNGLDGEWFQN